MSDTGEELSAAMAQFVDKLAQEAKEEARNIVLEGLRQDKLAPPDEAEWLVLDAGIAAGYAGAVVVLSRLGMLSPGPDTVAELTQRPEMKGTTP